MPNLFIVSGCNGSGKTTASYTLLPEMLKCRQFVNSDEFAKGLSPFNPEKASIGASRLMLIRVNYCLEKRLDFSIETTLATRSLLTIIDKAKEMGYNVTVLYFWIENPELAIERIKARVRAGGHNIPEETVRRRYRTGLVYFFKTYQAAADQWILADNTNIPFKIVAKGWNKNILVKDNIKYEAIRQMAEDFDK